MVFASARFYLRKPSVFSLPSGGDWRVPTIYLLLACAVGAAFSYWVIRVDRSPHGDWDATAIWNSHARYLYRDGPSWRQTILNTFHPDYPLLTAATTARLWRYMGRESPDASGLLDMVYALTAAGILTCTLARLRNASRAALFGLTLLGTPFYVDFTVSQSADVPLSLYVLATVALICLQSNAVPDHLGLLVLAGFTAGCAGWTKNEGLLFIVASSGALLVPIFWKPRDTFRRFAAFLLGLALPLAIILWFKLAVAPPNDIFGSRHYDEVVQKVLTPGRYLTIGPRVSHFFWSFGDWIVNPILLLLAYVGVHSVDRKMLMNEGWLQGAFTCAIVLAGYCAIYVITPMDLQWHLDASAPRLYLHIWPTFLMLAGLAGRR